ncbi:MAG: exosortase/archaeosortase family protein [Opitutae bacterium]|nr:exosortase/archaeosortase family protein [Opitutae bacterium]
MSTPAPSPPASSRAWLRPPVLWVSLPLLGFTAAFVARLWGEWTSNPDLSHGIFAPVIFGLLLWEGARHGTSRWLPHSRLLGAAALLVTALGVALFAAAGLLAATVGWAHALVSFVLATALVTVWSGALLILASNRVRALPFNWTVLTAIGLWLLAAPLPDGTYRRVMLTLQHSVTSGVLDSLHILGIPARQLGNVIELANTSVGVEEACSGIRSLISCLYAGFFFAAWLVRGAVRRTVLILVAPVLAIAMNFIRSLALTLMANAGTDIAGFWHDATGYAILGITALALAGLASLLGSPPRETTAPASSQLVAAMPRAWLGSFAALAATALALAVFFTTYHRRPPSASSSIAAAVEPEKLIPETAAGWHVETARDLYRFSALLRTRQLAERSYFRRTPAGFTQITLYVAHWAPGEASVSSVAAHTPDACWPGGGWAVGRVPDPQVRLEVGSQRLPTAEHRFFTQGALPQHVWFWHIYNDRPINYRDPYSVPALFEIAWRYGFRRDGHQYFVRFSSNQPWEKISREPLVQEIFARLAAIGISP